MARAADDMNGPGLFRKDLPDGWIRLIIYAGTVIVAGTIAYARLQQVETTNHQTTLEVGGVKDAVRLHGERLTGVETETRGIGERLNRIENKLDRLLEAQASRR